MIYASNLQDLQWVEHGFGERDSPEPEKLLTVRQIHSNLVRDGSEAGSEGDAIVSAEPGVLVGIKTADCVPVLLADTKTRAVAAIHAGWRGTAAGIVREALLAMQRRWNTRPEDVRAAIGPSIGVCCYEVSPDVAHRFAEWIPEMGQAEAAVKLDLRAANRRQIEELGVRDVWVSDQCTFCSPRRFFSFRREKENAGRLLSFIGATKI